MYIYIYIVIHRQTVLLCQNFSVSHETLQAGIETHLNLHQADDILLSQACDSAAAHELMDMYQVSFVCILCYQIPKCWIH